jgi:hypothetical protein
VSLEDGFDVIPDWADESERRIREYYRFRRDGLFVFVSTSPDDLDEDLQYRPTELQDKKVEWSVGAISQCLRALNYPATQEVAAEHVRRVQRRLF